MKQVDGLNNTSNLRAWLVGIIAEAIAQARAEHGVRVESLTADQFEAPPSTSLQLLTAGQISDLLGIPKRRVYELAKRGELPCVPIGRSVRFHGQSLEAWLAQREAQVKGSDFTPPRHERRATPRTSKIGRGEPAAHQERRPASVANGRRGENV